MNRKSRYNQDSLLVVSAFCVVAVFLRFFVIYLFGSTNFFDIASSVAARLDSCSLAAELSSAAAELL